MKMELLKWSRYQNKRSGMIKKCLCWAFSESAAAPAKKKEREQNKKNHKSNWMNNLTGKNSAAVTVHCLHLLSVGSIASNEGETATNKTSEKYFFCVILCCEKIKKFFTESKLFGSRKANYAI